MNSKKRREKKKEDKKEKVVRVAPSLRCERAPYYLTTLVKTILKKTQNVT
jgi:hypothetical protein